MSEKDDSAQGAKKRHAITASESRFVELFIVSLNASEAYAEAYGVTGPSAKNGGWRLLRRSRVARAIAKANAARMKRTAVDQDYVINSARDLLDRCLQRVPVPKRKGDPEGVHRWAFNAPGAAAALTILAKHTGLGERPNVNINIDFDSLTDAQLEHLANGGSLASLPR